MIAYMNSKQIYNHISLFYSLEIIKYQQNIDKIHNIVFRKS